MSAVVPVPNECVQEMKWRAAATLLLALVTLGCDACGPGRGVGRRRVTRKLKPLVFKEHVPNVSENILTASGAADGRIGRNDSRFRDLVPNYNQDIIFKDEEGTGADRLMTERCKEKLNTLAISVMNMWPGVKLLVTEGWDEEGYHTPDSLHYEGRAVDITTSDRDRTKYGMLAILAVEAGFDWVYYESRTHIHCSVKLETSDGARYGGCFPGESTVLTSQGITKKLADLQIGEKIQAQNPNTNELVLSEVILFLDYDPQQRRKFVELTLRSGRTLTVTPTHLLMTGLPGDIRTVFAGSVKTGDKLLVRDSVGIIEDYVVDVKAIMRTGTFAPLTEIGTVVVNDVVASCYATVDNQPLAHWAFLPVRLVWNIRRGFLRMWSVISKPMTIWSENPDDNRVISLERRSAGVHWYAKLLYFAADYLIPSHLHD